MLGHQSHLLQRCHLACGHEDYSQLSPVLFRLLDFDQVQHSYNSSTNDRILLTRVLTLFATDAKKNPFLTKTEFTRSAIIGGARGYLLDHLGYEGTSNHTAAGPRFPPKCDIIFYFSSMNCFYAVPGIIVQWVSPVTKIGLL